MSWSPCPYQVTSKSGDYCTRRNKACEYVPGCIMYNTHQKDRPAEKSTSGRADRTGKQNRG